MRRLTRRIDERGLLTVLVVLLAVDLGFLLGFHARGSGTPPAPATVTGSTASAAVSPSPWPTDPASPEDAGVVPRRVTIPAIGVEAPVTDLGLTEQGALATPERWEEAGWWSGGVRPGADGPAVIAGHVDSTQGPAVFFDLAELAPGDEVVVRSRESERVTFVVERLEQVPKDDFPTTRVYGPTEEPTLRLITCGGTFDDAAGHYRDNVVVYARMRDSSASA